MLRRNRISTSDKILWGIKKFMGTKGDQCIKSLDQIEEMADYVDNHGMQIEVVLRLIEWIGGREDIANPVSYLSSILLDYAKKDILTIDDYEDYLEGRASDGADAGKGMAAEKRGTDQKDNLQEAINRKTERILKKYGKL